MGTGVTLITAVAAPFASSSTKCKGLAVDPDAENDMFRRPLLSLALPPKPPSGSTAQLPAYGATSQMASSSTHSSPGRYRRDGRLGRVLEEDELDERDEEMEVEERGYYIGSYKWKVMLYTFVPLGCLLVFVLLAILPPLVWHSDPYAGTHYPRYFPAPLPELLVSVALWTLAHYLRLPLCTLTFYFFKSSIWYTLVLNMLHVVISQLLRLSALPILNIRHGMDYPLPTWQDPAFMRVWWMALGWSLADVAVGIVQGYEQLALYREVMIPEGQVPDVLIRWMSGDVGLRLDGSSRTPSNDVLRMSPHPIGELENGSGSAKRRSIENTIKLAVDKDLEEILRLKDREELEEIYGLPPIHIPVFVSCLQRIDSIILSLGHTLILAATYLRSPLSFPDGDLPSIYTYDAFAIGFPLVALVHLLLALLHSPLLLPRVGVHTMAYVGFLVGLGIAFVGLALWGALS